MRACDAVARVRGRTGIGESTLPDITLYQWLTELEGKVASIIFGVDPPEAFDEGDTRELLVPDPWGADIYVLCLAALAYHATGEYQRYENERARYVAGLQEYRAFRLRTAGYDENGRFEYKV